jgi:ribosomal protein L29
MRMAKKENLTQKNRSELLTLLSKEREELRKIRFESAGSRPKDTASAKKTRRGIARILTELHAKKVVVEGQNAAPQETVLAETAATA